MANHSEAFGTFTFEGDWSKKDLQYFYEVLSTQRYGEYTTNFNTTYDELLENESILFHANGRWEYYTNLECFDAWSSFTKDRWDSWKIETLPRAISFVTYSKHRITLLQSMHLKQLKVYVQYKDCETGFNFLGAFTGYLVCDDALHFSYKSGYTETIDANMKNYCEFFEDSNETLYDFVATLLDYLNIDDIYFDVSIETIINHPTWFDLQIYATNDMIYQDGILEKRSWYNEVIDALQEAGVPINSQYAIGLLDVYLNPTEIICTYDNSDLDSAIEYANSISTLEYIYGVFKETRTQHTYKYDLIWYDKSKLIF